MRITLDQPTFLTSLTNEKPSENPSDPSMESPADFLECMNALTTSSASSSETSASSDVSEVDHLKQDETQDASLDMINNVLIDMGYLMPTDIEKPLPVVPAANTVNANSDLVTGNPELPNQATPWQPTFNLNTAETERMAGASKSPEVMKDTPHDTAPTTEQATAMTENQSAPMTNSILSVAQSDKQFDDQKSLNRLLKAQSPSSLNKSVLAGMKVDEKSLTKQSQSETRQDLLNETKSTGFMEADTPKVTIMPMASTPIQSMPNGDDKVVNAFQQFGQWVQTKTETLTVTPPAINPALNQNELSQAIHRTELSGAAGAGAKVSVSHEISNVDINLTTYHAMIKIYPPELGKITAKLKMDKNIATLQVTADTKEVKALLQNHLPSLKEQFSGSNIQLDKIEITLADQKESSRREQDGQQEMRGEDDDWMQGDVANPKKTGKKQTKMSENAVDAYV